MLTEKCLKQNCDGDLNEIHTEQGSVYQCEICNRKFVFGLKNWERYSALLDKELKEIVL